MNDSRLPYGTLIEAVSALEHCTEFGVRFISRSGDPAFTPYDEVLARAQAAAGALQTRGLVPGDRVALILPSSLRFLDAFFGALLAGGIPAPFPPPFGWARMDDYRARTAAMLNTIKARFLVVDPALAKTLGPVLSERNERNVTLGPEDLRCGLPGIPVDVAPDDTALLQFTSASARAPRAVALSHAGLMHNLEMIDALCGTFPADEHRQDGVSCLPLYHVMGLVGGMLHGLVHPGTVTFIPTELFLSRPAIWLQTLSHYRAPLSSAPCFSYALCAERVRDDEMDGLDLSAWVAAVNSSEPIDLEGMRRFIERFSRWGFPKTAMTPAYGLAEAGLAVTFSDVRTPPVVRKFNERMLAEEGRAEEGEGMELVSLGRPMKGLEIGIRDDQGAPLKENLTGTVMVRGPSVMKGYYGDPDATRSVLRGEWLDTGDVGFLHQGELYLVGRRKDVVIIRGRNIPLEDVTALLEGVEGLRPGAAIAARALVPGRGEQLVILAERTEVTSRPAEELMEEIRRRVISGLSVIPHRIRILEPGTLPKDGSGLLPHREASLHLLLREAVPADAPSGETAT